MTVAEDIIRVIEKTSGLSEREISERIFGQGAAQQRVNSTCRLLLAEGKIKRDGNGGPGDPFTYSMPKRRH